MADYPGRGMHHILFDFAVQNQTEQGPEPVHLNAGYRVAEGDHAAVSGRPVFTGLHVGGEGLLLQCATVNVKNESDEALLGFLDSDAFKTGLQPPPAPAGPRAIVGNGPVADQGDRGAGTVT